MQISNGSNHKITNHDNHLQSRRVAQMSLSQFYSFDKFTHTVVSWTLRYTLFTKTKSIHNHPWRYASQLSSQTKLAESTQDWSAGLNKSLKPRFDLEKVQTYIICIPNYTLSYKLYQWDEQNNDAIGLLSLSRLHTGVPCNVVVSLSYSIYFWLETRMHITTRNGWLCHSFDHLLKLSSALVGWAPTRIPGKGPHIQNLIQKNTEARGNLCYNKCLSLLQCR